MNLLLIQKLIFYTRKSGAEFEQSIIGLSQPHREIGWNSFCLEAPHWAMLEIISEHEEMGTSKVNWSVSAWAGNHPGSGKIGHPSLAEFLQKDPQGKPC